MGFGEMLPMSGNTPVYLIFFEAWGERVIFALPKSDTRHEDRVARVVRREVQDP
jgi:hypothetical protein